MSAFTSALPIATDPCSALANAHRMARMLFDTGKLRVVDRRICAWDGSRWVAERYDGGCSAYTCYLQVREAVEKEALAARQEALAALPVELDASLGDLARYNELGKKAARLERFVRTCGMTWQLEATFRLVRKHLNGVTP